MGDRCYLQMTIRKCDLPKFHEVLGGDIEDYWNVEDDERPGLLTVSIDEANYGMNQELNELAELEVVLAGSHGAGGDYGPYRFCCIDGEHYEAEENEGGKLVLPVDEHGRASVQERSILKGFLAANKRAEKELAKEEKRCHSRS